MIKSIKQLLQFDSYDKMVQKKPHFSSKQKKSGEAFDFLHLVTLWPDIVGEVLAKHTIPIKNKPGVLTVLSNHSAFSHQLSFMQEILIKKIVKVFPQLQGKIKKINFQVDSTYFHEKKAMIEKSNIRKVENESRPELHPQSPIYKSMKAAAEQEFLEIEDPELKKALISISIQNRLR